MNKRPKKFLDQVRDLLRLKHYSIRTEESYISWIRKYILFHNKRHPKDMGSKEIEAFLSHLATKLKVSSSTQNQAFNALLFFTYGCGLRLMECVRLRVKDIDFENNYLIVRDAKGMKDRVTVLPNSLKPLLNTMIYTHIINKDGIGIQSPLDAL
jgi:integrase